MLMGDKWEHWTPADMTIRKSTRYLIRRGYEVWVDGKVVDAASNDFLDFLAVRVNHFKDMPETLREMMLARWSSDEY